MGPGGGAKGLTNVSDPVCPMPLKTRVKYFSEMAAGYSDFQSELDIILILD